MDNGDLKTMETFALEAYTEREQMLLAARDRIRAEGLTKSNYFAVESIRPGTLKSIDPYAIGKYPNHVQTQIALEDAGRAIHELMGTKGIAIAGAASLAIIGKLFHTIYKKIKGIGSDEPAKFDDKDTKEAIKEYRASNETIEPKKKEGDGGQGKKDSMNTLFEEIKGRPGCVHLHLDDMQTYRKSNNLKFEDLRKAARAASISPYAGRFETIMSVLLGKGISAVITIPELNKNYKKIVESLFTISDSFNKCANLLSSGKPNMNRDEWIKQLAYAVAELDDAFNTVRHDNPMIDKYVEDETYREKLRSDMKSRVSFWYQSEDRIDPNKVGKEIENAANQHATVIETRARLDRLADKLEKIKKDNKKDPTWLSEYFEGAEDQLKTVQEDLKIIRKYIKPMVIYSGLVVKYTKQFNSTIALFQEANESLLAKLVKFGKKVMKGD